MDFYQRFIELCNEKGVAPSRVALDIGKSKPAANGWKKKGSIPTDATLAKLAEYFNVSVEYLLGKSDAKNGHKKSAPAVSGKSDLRRLLDSYLDEFTDAEVEKLLAQIKVERNSQG